MPEKLPQTPFGVEIECAVPRSYFTGISGSDMYGYGGLIRSILQYGDFDFSVGRKDYTKWSVHGDGGSYDAGYTGVEIITPILKGEAGLREVRRMMDALKAIGVKAGSSCGMHIHISTEGTTGQQRLNWYAAMLRYESFLHQITAPRRHGNRLDSANLKDDVKRVLDNAYYGGSPLKDMPNGGMFGKSRRGLNTVEIRLHQGTVDGEKATQWVRLMLYMRQNGMKQKPLPDRLGGKSDTAFRRFLMRFGVPKETREYWVQKRLEYQGEQACEDMPLGDLRHYPSKQQARA